MKLIKCSDYVIEQSGCFPDGGDIGTQIAVKLDKVEAYAKFLKRPLELGMFIPTDKEGNVLEYKDINHCQDIKEWAKYQEAKDRVLFKGFEVLDFKETFSSGLIGVGFMIADNNPFCVFWKSKYLDWYLSKGIYTIEDLVTYKLELTESAVKQLKV